jgi:hypothetical protein
MQSEHVSSSFGLPLQRTRADWPDIKGAFDQMGTAQRRTSDGFPLQTALDSS